MGADNVAVLIAEAPHRQEDTVLIVDIGTNGEIALGNRHWLLSASSPTGPAFEGGAAGGLCLLHRDHPGGSRTASRSNIHPLAESRGATGDGPGVVMKAQA